MNKKLAAFCQAYGMTVDGNLAKGQVKGFETTLLWEKFDMQWPVKIHISAYANDDQKKLILAEIRKLAIPYSSASFTQYGLLLGYNDPFTAGRLMKRLPAATDAIFAIMTEQGARGSGFCPVCGEVFEGKENKQYTIGKLPVTLHCECASDINKVIENQNAQFDAAPDNYFKGFLGALVGSLAGAAFAILLYIAGFVSAISAVIAMAAGTFLYRKFGGKPNKVMIAIVTVTSLVVLELAIVAIYVVASGIAAAQAGVPMSPTDAFWMLMTDAEFSRLFYTDLALTFVFALVGAIVEIFYLLRQIKREKTIK